MKRLLSFVVAGAMLFGLSGLAACGSGVASGKPEIALICSAAGKNDNGYNQSAIEGLEAIAKEKKFAYKVVETSDSLSVPDALKQMASAGAKLVFSLEYDFDALVKGVGGQKALAEQYPDTKFVVFNANPNVNEQNETLHKNVISVLFNVHESSYLAGYLSVLVNENLATLFDDSDYRLNKDSASNRVLGFIGGTASDGITVFSTAYAQGINAAAEKLNIKYDLLTKLDAGFADAAVGTSFAQSVYTMGGNIVFTCAGNVGTGVTSKANDEKRLAIEVDANKDDKRPGYILTSVLKNTNVPVTDLVNKYLDKTLDEVESVLNYSLKSGATGLTDMVTISSKIKDKATWQNITDELASVKSSIESGEIKITNEQIGEKTDLGKLTHLNVK